MLCLYIQWKKVCHKQQTPPLSLSHELQYITLMHVISCLHPPRCSSALMIRILLRPVGQQPGEGPVVSLSRTIPGFLIRTKAGFLANFVYIMLHLTIAVRSPRHNHSLKHLQHPADQHSVTMGLALLNFFQAGSFKAAWRTAFPSPARLAISLT